MKYIKLKTRQTFLCISKSDDLTVNYSGQCSGLGVPNSAEHRPEVRRLRTTLHHSLCLRTTQDNLYWKDPKNQRQRKNQHRMTNSILKLDSRNSLEKRRGKSSLSQQQQKLLEESLWRNQILRPHGKT